MKKYLILCFILALTLTSVNAQDRDSDYHHHYRGDTCKVGPRFAPQQGDFTAAMVFGRGAYLNGGLAVPSSYSSVSGAAPYANTVDANYNDITNMVGAEGRYYATNRFAITLSGGAILRDTPAQLAIPAVTDINGNQIIPAYNAVVADERIDLNVSVGGQWLFNTKNDRLFPYVGFALPYSYARQSMYDPTVSVDGKGNVTITDLGARHVEINAFGAQAVAGVDYYIAKDIFFGFEIKPVSYVYAYSVKVPGPGLYSLEADTNTLSFFAQFSFKVGFKF
ncbi:MAG TPA: BT1926 family outer membrane beta-barrel protein [Lutibacter sp.]